MLKPQVSGTLLVLGLLGGACVRQEVAVGLRQRWIEAEPEAGIDRELFLGRAARFEWRLDDPQERARWLLIGGSGETLRGVAGGVRVPYAEPVLRLRRAVRIEAADLHELELELDGATAGQIQVHWAQAEQALDRERVVKVAAGQVRDGVVRLDLAAHPLWSGTIRWLAVTPTMAPGQTVVVRAVRGVQRTVDAAGLSRVVAQPWKVRIGDDLRNALPAPPGLRREKSFRVPSGGRLRLSYAVTPQVFEPIAFRVEVLSGAEPPAVLLEDLLEPAEESEWIEADLDLAAYAGRHVTISLRTEAASAIDLARMLPVWANPEVVGEVAEERPPNVVLISIDTLRADRMSSYGHHRSTTPGLDAWARRSAVRFETVVAPSPWTLPSHASLFTGLGPLRHGANYHGEVDPALGTLAEVLRGAGYATAAFTAGAYLSPEFGLGQGFDSYRVRLEAPGHQGGEDELVRGLDEVRAWLARRSPGPFFLFFHTYEVHTPYRPRAPFFERFGGDPARLPAAGIDVRPVPAVAEDGFRQRQRFVLRDGHGGVQPVAAEDGELVGIAYDSGVAFMDQQVSRFLGELEQAGVADDTVVVLTSDHGEMLGEHDAHSHGYLYDENLLVPLFLTLPGGGEGGRVVAEQVRLVDVFPTLLELAGVEPETGLDGKSLLPLLDERARERRRRPAWSYAASTNGGLALRHGDRLKYVFRNAVWAPCQGYERLYDLRSDPGELRDLAADSALIPALRNEARERLEAITSGLRLRLTNRGDSVVQGRLRGPMMASIGVTSPDVSCECFHWVPGVGALFEVPADVEVTLHLERASVGDLHLEGEVVGGGPGAAFRHTYDVGELERPVAHVFDGAGWVEATAGTAGEVPVQIRLWWQGARERRAERPLRDDRLLEQLQALGYLN